MDKVFWLVPGQIAGRSGPNKDPWEVSELAEHGFDLLVSLNDATGVDLTELAQHSIDHLHIELPASIPPKDGDEQICLNGLMKAWQQLQPRLDRDQTILIHCRSGKDRTGMLMAYLIMRIEKLSPQQAIAAVIEVRPIALSADGWLPLAEQVLSQLEPEIGHFSA